uniref:Uncharacterized protein n=1 Tax=Trichogramma kaykai TaxID=54128 RepID=A0ABD2WU44_9HYME
MSSEDIHSNNRQEEAQSDGEAPSYDRESLSSLATQGDSMYAHAGPSPGGSSINVSVSGSTLTLRRGSNPYALATNSLPPAGRYQAEAPQPIDPYEEGDQVNISMDITPPMSENSKNEMNRGTMLILGGGAIVVLFFVFAYVYLRYIRVPHD